MLTSKILRNHSTLQYDGVKADVSSVGPSSERTRSTLGDQFILSLELFKPNFLVTATGTAPQFCIITCPL